MEMAQPCALLGRAFSPRLVAERGGPIFRPRVYIGLSAMMGRLGHVAGE